jgi:hypothetical protein
MTPSAINRLDDTAKLEVQWPDEVTATLLYRDLRLACGCVDWQTVAQPSGCACGRLH